MGGNRKLNGGIARYPEETRIFSWNPISYFYDKLHVIDPIFSIDCGGVTFYFSLASISSGHEVFDVAT